MRRLFLATILARRDLRGGLGSFWIMVVGIALGVAAIAGVGSVADAVLAEVRGNARESIGGDVALRLFHHPATPEQTAFLKAAGRHSETAELRPQAHRPDGTAAALVELKAVDDAYPLYGTVRFEPAHTLAAATEARQGVWGAAVDRQLLDALGLKLGQALRLGGIEVELRAEIVHEPDRTLRMFSLGPRVMIARTALEASGLAPAGAQVYWYNRVRLADGMRPADWIAAVERRFPDAGWRVVDADDGVPGIERVVMIGRLVLVLVALSILLIGGVGVAAAVAAHLARKTATIAVLKSLGATGGVVFAVFLLQVLGAGLAGTAIGLGIGAATPAALSRLLPLDAAPQPGALGLAASFGLITALLFALWPLGRAQRIPPQQLFRDLVVDNPERPRPAILFAIAIAAASLLALLLAASGMPWVAAAFAAASAATLVTFLGVGIAIAWSAGRIRTRRPLLRLALRNLSRRGAATASVVMALGLSLTLLVAVKTIEGNAIGHLEGALPRSAPDAVFINLPPTRGDGFDALVRATAGVEKVRRVPFVHATVTHLAGAPARDRRIPADLGWVLRGDRGLSWAATMPDGSRLAAGAWWPADYRGRPLASLDADAARRLGLSVGDHITLNMLGRPTEVEIANLRVVDWTRLGLDFPILLSPPAEPPPHSEIAAVWAAPGALSELEATMRLSFPEAPVIRVAPVLAALETVVRGGAGVLTGVAAVTIAAALLVLAGVVANGYRQRVREMVLLKVVGARPRQLLGACVVEFALLGTATAIVAGALGSVAAYAVVARLMPDGWRFLPTVPLTLGAAAVAVMTGTALLLARRALARSPAEILRQRLPIG